LEVGELDKTGIVSLRFPCRRKSGIWYNAWADEPILIFPTHWRIWRASTSWSFATSSRHSKPNQAMPIAKARASTILVEFDRAQAELVGKAVILADGKAGTVERIWLDEFGGLRISVKGHDGKWPVSTIRLAQQVLA
jgi:hypothetical protein